MAMTTETATVAGFWVAVVSLFVSALGFVFAVIALRRGNLNSSAAIVLTLMENFRHAWERFLKSEGEQQDFEFHELMNLIEAACALHGEKSLVGASGKLIETYLTDILAHLEQDAGARERIKAMRHSPDTFEHCVCFLAAMKAKGRPQKMGDVMTPPNSPEVPVVPSSSEAANAP